MSWRIVEISNRAKLDMKMNYLIIRKEDITKIHLSEISVLIIESTAVSLTAALIVELAKRKIKVIFCDEKRNPIAENISYYGSHDTSLKVRTEINWNDNTKKCVWTKLVTEKILKQKELLAKLDKQEYKKLDKYLGEIEFYDVTNREGHAAKVYFNSLFGKDFTRSKDNNINAALNYGYAILLSAFNREIVSNGYITQLGLFHDNVYNMFNLSCDLMEPFRPLVDECVYFIDHENFMHDEKIELVNLLNKEVLIDNKKQYVNNAIKIYCKSILDALDNNDISKIKDYRNEL
ncbi:MAG: type II CRISPR-associated endonuclease Cas1 [Clostridia bacterium]